MCVCVFVAHLHMYLQIYKSRIMNTCWHLPIATKLQMLLCSSMNTSLEFEEFQASRLWSQGKSSRSWTGLDFNFSIDLSNEGYYFDRRKGTKKGGKKVGADDPLQLAAEATCGIEVSLVVGPHSLYPAVWHRRCWLCWADLCWGKQWFARTSLYTSICPAWELIYQLHIWSYGHIVYVYKWRDILYNVYIIYNTCTIYI